MPPQSRREFVRTAIAGASAATSLSALLACASNDTEPSGRQAAGGSARLSARPKEPTLVVTPGTYTMTPGATNDAILVVPPGAAPTKQIPLVLGLHGAGGLAQGQVNLMAPSANERGFAFLAVGSRGLTWDAVSSRSAGFGIDITFIDHALAWAFDRVAVNPARVMIEGFSDGASYTLGLALANGDLFSRAVAFSPGFIPQSDSPAVGKPKFFDSHGRQDTVLPIDTASRSIVPALQHDGYSVTYVEFDGGHEIPPTVLQTAVDFIMG